MANYHAEIQQLYVAYFNRPADVAGLEYWDKVVSAAKGDLSAVSAGFAASSEFAARYAGLDAAAVHGQLFQNMFGRPIQLGGAYIGLPEGPVTADKIVKYFADTAPVPEKAALDNKVKAALGFTGVIDTSAEAASYASPGALGAVNAFMNSITADTATLPANFDSATATVFANARTTLTTGADIIVGTGANDTFSAPLIGPVSALQPGDRIDGGAGSDRINLELSDASKAAQAFTSSAVETVSIRAVASVADSTNSLPGRAVLVAPSKVEGVIQWESNRSNTDLLIDGIRLLPTQVTKDVTIIMQSTDAGNVDFGAYFEPDAIRAHTPNVLRTQLMVTRNAAAHGSPLEENPYNGFAIYFNGVKTVIASDAIHAAKTYDALFAAIEAAVRAVPALNGVTVTKGTFQVFDTLGTPLTGTEIILTAPVGDVFSHGEGSRWLDPYLHSSSAYSTLLIGDVQNATATIVLDDVGRGGTGGDLVAGARVLLEDGNPFNGIARFEIEVRDSSKLQSISSTTQALREVVLKNGVTSDHGSGLANQGDLTVLGSAGPVVSGTGSDALPGDEAHNEFGFSNVVVIDATAMTGKISFDAEITVATVSQFPAGEYGSGTNFLYSGGANDDSMKVAIDGGVLASNGQRLSDRGDAIFQANGGAGNDDISVVVKDGTASLGHNVFLNGGTGNDTLRMEGNANAVIKVDAAFGTDKVIGFTAGTGTGNDQLDFSALGGRAAAFSGTTVSNADGAITVQLQTAANDSVAEIAALYTDGSTATKHVFVAYDASNVGKVYSVVDGAASAVTVTQVGSIDLADTSWNALVSDNFA